VRVFILIIIVYFNMNKVYTAFLLSILLLCLAGETFGQQKLVSDAKKQALADTSVKLNNSFLANHQKALGLAKKYGWPLTRRTKNGGLVLLQGVNSLGFPVYLATYDNIIAAATTQTNTVQPGGVLGLNLSGRAHF
jgi:hypothetical protein